MKKIIHTFECKLVCKYSWYSRANRSGRLDHQSLYTSCARATLAAILERDNCTGDVRERQR